MIGTVEGRMWRYEVCEHADGYLVRMRDLSSGEVEEDTATIFRTLSVAYAFADMAAALDIVSAAETEEDDLDPTLEMELEHSRRHFIELRDKLHDDGIHASHVNAWQRKRHKDHLQIFH